MTNNVRWERKASTFVVNRPSVIEPEVRTLQYSADRNVACCNYDVTVVMTDLIVGMTDAIVRITAGQQKKEGCHVKIFHGFHSGRDSMPRR